MNADLAQLEQRIDQVLALCQTLRRDNHDLRAQVAAADAEQKKMREKLELARLRLESLVERLPAP
jgi:cell division protein ZapB